MYMQLFHATSKKWTLRSFDASKLQTLDEGSMGPGIYCFNNLADSNDFQGRKIMTLEIADGDVHMIDLYDNDTLAAVIELLNDEEVNEAEDTDEQRSIRARLLCGCEDDIRSVMIELAGDAKVLAVRGKDCSNDYNYVEYVIRDYTAFRFV